MHVVSLTRVKRNRKDFFLTRASRLLQEEGREGTSPVGRVLVPVKKSFVIEVFINSSA
jgi:hypothetical protein